MPAADPVALTADFLRGLAPRSVYFTLRGKATEATLEGVTIVENQSFRLRPIIRFVDQVFDNPCAVAKAMHQHLCGRTALIIGRRRRLTGGTNSSA